MDVLVLFWFVFSGFCAWVATQKGRSFVGWLLLALLLSPLVAMLALIAVPATGRRAGPAPPAPPRAEAWKDGREARDDTGFPDLPPRP